MSAEQQGGAAQQAIGAEVFPTPVGMNRYFEGIGMTKYVDNAYMETITCCDCSIIFAVPQEFDKQKLKDQSTFYCPSGHAQSYCESSEAKLKRKVRLAEQRAQHEQTMRIQAEEQSKASNRRYGRIRDRVKNGVCPCCNRSFENLARHMATKHPRFGKYQTLKTMRLGVIRSGGKVAKCASG